MHMCLCGRGFKGRGDAAGGCVNHCLDAGICFQHVQGKQLGGVRL